MVPGQRRDNRLLQARLDCGQEQHVCGADGEPGRDQRIGALAGLARVDAGAPREGLDRQAGRARVLDHHAKRAQLGVRAIAGIRIERQARATLERGGGANRGPRRMRIEHETAGDGHRR